MTDQIKLTVAYHPSGNHTLMQSINGSTNKDLEDHFFANSDRGEFYRAVAGLIAQLAAEGHSITYDDTWPPNLNTTPNSGH